MRNLPSAPRVPGLRVTARNPRAIRREGDYVLYWMTAQRRTRSNFALDRAVEHALDLERPLLVFEALRAGHHHACDRTHRFVLDGMRANAADCAAAGVAYLPYVEPEAGTGRGLLEALAQRACVVVADDHPGYFLPRMVASAAARLPLLLEAVDSNGLLPLRASDDVFPTAYAFRRCLQRVLRPHLDDRPLDEPLALAASIGALAEIAPAILRRWPSATAGPETLPIDHAVPIAPVPGGSSAARDALRTFVRERLPRYAEDRNEPSLDATSGLSAWLHFGHLSTHEVLAEIADAEAWTPARTAPTASGRKDGWWGLPPSAEAYLDQVVTWRELGFHTAAKLPGWDGYASLPAWSRATLERHAGDRREHLYALGQLEDAATHDPLWNAAQTQLLREGRIHNYLRMLWGKKILEWTASPQQAFETMVALNDRWALDGRDPNSISGIAWVLGRYDRPWGPERPVFGVVRTMSSANAARKLDLAGYLRRWSPAPAR